MTLQPACSREKLRDTVRWILKAGVEAVDPHAAVHRCLMRCGDSLVLAAPGDESKTFDLSRFERVVVVGAGKATARMAQAVEEILGDNLTAGLVVVKYDHLAPLERVEIVEAAHPVPDASGEAGARRLVQLLEPLDESSLVISLISGGGSALLALPATGITLADKQCITGLLLGAGADIKEMNAVRKHLSGIKGGHLARTAAPATVINLILSDVVGDHLDVIASGPTIADPTTLCDARAILERYDLWQQAPVSIQRRFSRETPETPKPGDPIFERCHNSVIGSNRLALAACEREAQALGYHTLLLSSSIEGETDDVARMHAAIAREIRATGRPIPAPACILSGGETTVTLRAHGLGGRNQQFALAAAGEVAGLEGVAFLSCGTDGTDGITDAAGAIAFGDTASRAAAHGFSVADALTSNNAYPLFDAIGDLIRTGPTGTNVMDLHIIIIEAP